MAKKTKVKAKAASKKPAAKKAKPAAKKPAAKAAKKAPGKKPDASGGYAWVIPYLHVKDGRAALDFYKKAFGMKETRAMEGPGGMVVHAEMEHHGHAIMMGTPHPGMGSTPSQLGGSPLTLYCAVPDVDKFYAHAVAAGAKSMAKPETKFYGDRTCALADPDGHLWGFYTHVKDVSDADMMAEMEKMMKSGGHGGGEHEHTHSHAEGAAHHHAHEHEHGGEKHSHEHSHEHEHGAHGEHTHSHDHSHDHAHDHSHEHGNGHTHGHSHGHSHEGHSH